jgi:hypothetical protein
VIGQRQCAQSQLDCPFSQIINGRGAIEEREIGVAVKLGEAAGHNCAILERMF